MKTLCKHTNISGRLINPFTKNYFNILKEMQKGDPTQGIGKPEALKHELAGYYSRRLSDKDRLIYSFDDENIYIIAIGGHYEG
jgi:toxin YoeB